MLFISNELSKLDILLFVVSTVWLLLIDTKLILLLFIIEFNDDIFLIKSDNVGNNNWEIRFLQNIWFFPISYKLDFSFFNLLLIQFEKSLKLWFLIFSLLWSINDIKYSIKILKFFSFSTFNIKFSKISITFSGNWTIYKFKHFENSSKISVISS